MLLAHVESTSMNTYTDLRGKSFARKRKQADLSEKVHPEKVMKDIKAFRKASLQINQDQQEGKSISKTNFWPKKYDF